MAAINCRYFSGYKPCLRAETCDSTCPSYEIGEPRILIVHLEALGAVLRATSILPAIKRKFPKSHITWVTQRPAEALLKPNQMIDRVLTTAHDDLLVLRALQFDLAFVVDKSLKASGVLTHTQTKELRGFTVDPKTGAILPANPEAEELWQLGLSDKLKFYVNQKPETQLLVEALDLGEFKRDPYVVELTASEKALINERARAWRQSHKTVIGLNTGCSEIIPYKKWTVNFHRQVIAEIQKHFDAEIVLLGGPEDTFRNLEIGKGLKVISSPTDRGLRDGLCSVAACDIVLSGDSLGLHMAIALKRFCVAWFGPTCSQEIDLYDRGVKLHSLAPCAPCWKRSCTKSVMCYDQVPVEAVISAVEQGLKWTTSLSKPHSLATSF